MTGVRGLILVFVLFHNDWSWDAVGVPGGGGAGVGAGQLDGDRWSMVERLRRMVESRHRDLGVVAARNPEGEVDKFREVLQELENITVEGGGVVTRNKVQRLEARIRHWEDRLRDLERVCKRPVLAAGFRQCLRELERVRVKIGGRCLGQPEEELEGEGFANRPRGIRILM